MSKLFFKRNLFQVNMVLALCLVVFVTTGCEPLRKKFVRKKKDGDETTQVTAILDPQDYPEKIKAAGEIYKEHYGLWKIWQNDLLLSVEDDRGDRRVLSTINQMQEQLRAMGNLLTENKRQALDSQFNELRFIENKFQNSSAFRNKDELTSRIRLLGRTMRDNFSPEKVKDSLAPIQK